MPEVVLGLGAMNLDLVYQVSRNRVEGEGEVLSLARCPGGSAANTIYALAKLGIQTGFIGAVGDDQEGRALIASFQEAGVDCSAIAVKKGTPTGQAPSTSSGQALCIADRRGHRAIYLLPGANHLLGREDIPFEKFPRATILHMSSFVGERQLDLQKEIATSLPPYCHLSFAPGSVYAKRGLRELEPLLRRAWVLFLNREELEALSGEGFPQGVARLLGAGCHMVAVTLGGKEGQAAYIATPWKSLAIPARPVPRKVFHDSIGAGDAFAAGFLFGLLRGKELRECGLLGELIARLSIAGVGARGNLPPLSLLARLYLKEQGIPL